MTQHQMGTCRTGEVEIFYRQFGQPGGIPIIIVHGLSYFSYDWIGPAAALAVDREVVAMDMRGFGNSGWAKDYAVPAFARDIIALLDHLGWDKAILVGHSMGGRNCVYCAATYPDRVAGLVLVDWSPENAPAGSQRVSETVAGTPDLFPSIEAAMLYFKTDPHSPQGALQRPRFEAYLKPEPGGYAVRRDPHFRDQFRRLLQGGERPKAGVDLWATLAAVTCPTLVLRGRRSDMFADAMVPRVQAANPRLRLEELETGHNVAGEDPEGFLRHVRTFLAGLAAGPTPNPHASEASHV